MPSLPADLAQADFVLVRKDGHKPPLTPAYEGPYKVLCWSLLFFRVQMGNQTDSVSTHRLKAAYKPAGAEPAQPPCPGRPPAQPAPSAPARPRGRPKRVTFRCQVDVIPVQDYSPPAEYFRSPTTTSSTSTPLPPASRSEGEPYGGRGVRPPSSQWSGGGGGGQYTHSIRVLPPFS